MRRLQPMLAALFGLSACASVPVHSATGPVAGIGRTATVGGVRVNPLRVLEDSRCPALVRCIWAGRLRIEALIQFHGGSEELRREMTLGEAILLPEGRLTLSAAEPTPDPGKALDPGAYRFTFTLTP